MPPNVTTLSPVVLNPRPTIVTSVPAGPDAGEKLAIESSTVKLAVLVEELPPTVTFNVPDVAAAGTSTASCVGVADSTVAAAP
jgi:hypothetical protein